MGQHCWLIQANTTHKPGSEGSTSDLSPSCRVFKSFSWATASSCCCCSRWGATDRGGQCVGMELVVRLGKVPILLTNISSLSISGKFLSHSSLVLSCCLLKLHGVCFSEMTSEASTGDGILLQESSVPDLTPPSLVMRMREGMRQTKHSQVKWKGRKGVV